MKTNLYFLKRCRDLSIVPLFSHIKHRLNNSGSHRIFLNTSLALICYEIARVRSKLDSLSRNLLSLHLELSSLFFP